MLINGTGITGASGWQILQGSFTATTTSVWFNVFAQGTIYLDNMSLKIADADRSVNARGLQVVGTITKLPVAAGAEMTSYSGFSTTNYLMQPYNSALDPGTGEYMMSAWVYLPSGNSGGYYIINRGVSDSDEAMRIGINNRGVFFEYGSTIPSYAAAAANTVPYDTWFNITCTVRAGGTGRIYINGTEPVYSVVGGLCPSPIESNSYPLYIGYHPLYTSGFFPGRIALVRYSLSVPSVEKIKKMYDEEKQLFQENAKATLYGTSNRVTAIGFDDDTKLLHVGTSSGRSVFDGLRRIDNTTTAVARTIAAGTGLVAED
jgi:hypothetical protein